MTHQTTDTASAALLKLAECIRDYTEDLRSVTWLAPFSASEIMARDKWLADEFDKFADAAEAVVASLPAPAAPVIVVQVPDGWRVAQWDGQRYVSCIGLPYPTERQANSDCALILARVQPTVESRLP